MNLRQTAFPDLHELVQLFYDQPEDLARFYPVQNEQMPEFYRSLLNHDHHMTVTLETYHGSSVDVHVLDYDVTNDIYMRQILLTRHDDGRVVQYGIVRLHLQYLTQPVRAEITSRRIPLGRVLMNHNVLRRVELVQLWQVTPGVDLCQHFQLAAPSPTFGRTAIIHCHDEPAVELLEIVAPANMKCEEGLS